MAELRQRRSPKGERRREEIIAIAAQRIATVGIDRATMQEIADAAGLTKAAIQHHFPEKLQLYEAVVLSRSAETYARVLAATDRAATPLAKLTAYVGACAVRIEDDRAGWVASSNLFRALKEQTDSTAVVAAHRRLHTHLCEIVEAGIADGTFRKVDAATFARLLFTAISAIPRWHDPADRRTVRTIAAEYLDMLLEGVVAPK